MGLYLNPNEANFKEMISQEVYVDKTMMISVINHYMDTNNKYICVSRPRRFGKTMASNMLATYYSKGCDSKELFSRFKIAGHDSFESKLNKYNVIKIDLNGEYQITEDKENLISKLSRRIKKEFVRTYPDIDFEDDDSLAECILDVYIATNEQFVVLIDEYDVLVRENVSEELLQSFLSFLNGLFKSDLVRPAIALAYLTGILPVVRDKIQSKLNNFAEYIGFTSDEVRDLCTQYDMDFEECKHWYDGYSQHGYEIYNPESVVKSMMHKRYMNYWSKTSTYQVVAEQIRRDFKGVKEDVVKMLSGESVEVSITQFMNRMDSFITRDDVFTYLAYIGYLAYDIDTGTCYIPNKEVRLEWFSAVQAEEEYSVTDEIIKQSKELLLSTLSGDTGAVAKALDTSHIHVTSNRSYNNEDALQSAIYLAYIYALNEYTIVKEMTTGKGFADVCFIPFNDDKPAMIIELKRNDSVYSALDQIKDKRYFDSLAHYQGDLLFVGINYDEKQKTHECKIEKFVK